jgi:mannosyl-3-phosphoglycerate phosphatase family protein
MSDDTKIVVFTDLDGTLIDQRNYSFVEALPALHAIRERGVPLVICSSKTAAEIEYYRERLGNRHPFISENGGGIFVPNGYFGLRIADHGFDGLADSVRFQAYGAYEIVRLGARYEDLRKVLETLRQSGFPVRGFGDMSTEEISGLTGLSLDEARMAQKREFDEPFIIEGDEVRALPVFEAIESMGFNHTFGRLCHVIGNSDKGKAVSLLVSLYRAQLKDFVSIAVGDAPNDIPMLQAVDYPVVVQQPDGSYEGDVKIPGLIRADGKGPAGWNRAIIELLARLN